MCIKEICDESEVEFWISGYKRGRRKKFTTVQPVGILKDFFGPLKEVAGLERGAAADVRC